MTVGFYVKVLVYGAADEAEARKTIKQMSDESADAELIIDEGMTRRELRPLPTATV